MMRSKRAAHCSSAYISTAMGLLLLLTVSYPIPITSSNLNFDGSPHGLCPGGLKCHHGGECAVGDKDHTLDHPIIISSDIPDLEVVNINGEHCINCHDGWGGVDCSRPYQICDESDPHAPTCFNGGACYKMGINAITGKYNYMCDCTNAGQERGGDHTKKYAGKYCQHEREVQCADSEDTETSLISSVSMHADEMFCTNGGKCVSVLDEQDWTHKQYTCKCPSHRAGTHCEFLKEEGFEDCRLECEHGTCSKGFKSYDELIGSGPFPAQLAFDIISANGEHCVCPSGWTGLNCEIPVEKCAGSSDKYCYNGAKCQYFSDGSSVCDCNTAHTEDVSFAGVSCELEHTSYCEPGFDQDQKDAFCTNHGQCVVDSDSRHTGCICEDGWSGDLCDIEGDEEPVCDLNCENGGSCRLGVKGYKDDLDELYLPALATKHNDGMYCSCPEGFTGVRCEVDVNHCHLDDGSKSETDFCLNGVQCAPENPDLNGIDKKFSCQCNEGSDEISQMLSGRFCEYAVTEYCSKNRARHSHSFCTNGGKCKKENDEGDSEHHGCCCSEGYEGEYCQLPAGTLDLESTKVTWSPYSECSSQGKYMGSHNTPSAADQLDVFPVAPKPNSEWEHVSINPKFEVPANVSKEIDLMKMTEEFEEYLEEKKEALHAAAPEDNIQQKSNIGGIVSGVVGTLLIVGVAGVLYKKRSMKDGSAQFDSDWWSGHTSDWWASVQGGGQGSPTESVFGDGSIGSDEMGSNIAPKTLQRQWSYPEGHTLSHDSLDDPTKKWEHSIDFGDLHDVMI